MLLRVKVLYNTTMATKPSNSNMFLTKAEAVRLNLPENATQIALHNLRVKLEKSGRLTAKQATRLVDILSMGPLGKEPVDDVLLERGWVEFYDEEMDAVVAVDYAERILYDSVGCISDIFVPEEWRERTRRNRVMMGGAR